MNSLIGFIGASLVAVREQLVRFKQLDKLFARGNVLTAKASGEQFFVVRTIACKTILVNRRGHSFIVDWLSPAGQLRDDLLNRYQVSNA